MDKDQQTKQKIRQLYKDLTEVAILNEPEAYVMPKALYEEIIRRVAHLDDYLREARKSRDNWRAKYYELKNKKNGKSKL